MSALSVRRRLLCVTLAGWISVFSGCTPLAAEMCAEAQQIQIGMNAQQVRKIVNKPHRVYQEPGGVTLCTYRYLVAPWVPVVYVAMVVQVIPLFFFGLISGAMDDFNTPSLLDVRFDRNGGVMWVGPVRSNAGGCEHVVHAGY